MKMFQCVLVCTVHILSHPPSFTDIGQTYKSINDLAKFCLRLYVKRTLIENLEEMAIIGMNAIKRLKLSSWFYIMFRANFCIVKSQSQKKCFFKKKN